MDWCSATSATLGHELTEEQVKAIGKVDVLMIPVGGIYTINGEVAKKVCRATEAAAVHSADALRHEGQRRHSGAG